MLSSTSGAGKTIVCGFKNAPVESNSMVLARTEVRVGRIDVTLRLAQLTAVSIVPTSGPLAVVVTR